MKKYFLICTLGCILFSCQKLADSVILDDMGKSYERHLKSEDKENEMQSKIEMLVPVSYVKLTEDEKIEAEDAYLGKIYQVSKSWYIGGSRVYNVNDTISIYFNKDKRFIRIQDDRR